MNIWALDRHQDIRHVLLLLHQQLGPEAFVIDAATPAEPQAIYLQHPGEAGVRAWLHTLGQGPGRYGVHLEYPQTSDTRENLSLAELVAILAVHFDVPVIHPLP